MWTNESRVSPNAATSGATASAVIPRTQPARSLICIAHASAMLTPSMTDERAAALSRVPAQSGHVPNVTASSTKARTCGCIESTSLASIDFSMRGTSPS